MFKYTPHYKPNQIVTGQGQIAIVTGWTVKQSLEKKLSKDSYAAIGNLYSPTRGINPLLRNLLANPHVRYLAILDATREDKNAGGCQCLFDFFEHGFELGKSDTGRECWVIKSSVTGYIDIEIPADVLEHLRRSLKYRTVNSISNLVGLVTELAEKEHLEAWGEPLIFPQSENIPNIIPGTRYGHRIEGKTIAETWVKILHRIKTTGTIRPTGYDGKWQELIDLVVVVTDEPDGFYFPEPNYLPIDSDFIDSYLPQMLDDAPYTEGVKYTYGQRMRSWFGQDQIEKIINKLIGEIDSASAVINLWDSGTGTHRPHGAISRFKRDAGDSDHDHGGSPCLNHIWVRVVDGEMSLTATFRSNDMFSAWVANAMGLRALQKHILDEINKRSEFDLTIGPLITISQSAHIYDDTWENVDKLIATQYAQLVNKRDYFDPSGNFVIELQENQIVVNQLTSGSGEVVSCYSGKNPLKLVREICSASPVIHPEHIGYLGIELQKAAIALKDNQEYTQDNA